MSGIAYNLTKIRAFVFDVDGVLSPSTIPMDAEGNPMRMANIKDGYALQLACRLGYHCCIITGGRTEAVVNRFNALGITDIYQGAAMKLPVLKAWMEEKGLKPEEVAYIGDDIPDIEVLEFVGLSCCPSDAANDVFARCKYVSKYAGGHGCVRDVVEQTLKAHGNWMANDKAFGW